MSLLVRHVMTDSPKTLRPSMHADDAAGLMAQYDIGIVPIVDGDALVGLVTDRDLVVRVLADRAADPSAVMLGDIATSSIVTVTPDARLSDARELMQRHRVRRLPVVKADRLVGIVSLGDRKSTRLNSSHVKISYAVFCLKKKTATSSPSPTSRMRRTRR